MIPNRDVYNAAMEVIDWLMDVDPDPNTQRQRLLKYLVGEVQAFERAHYSWLTGESKDRPPGV